MEVREVKEKDTREKNIYIIKRAKFCKHFIVYKPNPDLIIHSRTNKHLN